DATVVREDSRVKAVSPYRAAVLRLLEDNEHQRRRTGSPRHSRSETRYSGRGMTKNFVGIVRRSSGASAQRGIGARGDPSRSLGRMS
ncbi:MAG: hypothetical protein ACRD3Q_22350, partial [Terriglobales bacterium]